MMSEWSSGQGFGLGGRDLDLSLDVFTNTEHDFRQVPWTSEVFTLWNGDFIRCLKIFVAV